MQQQPNYSYSNQYGPPYQSNLPQQQGHHQQHLPSTTAQPSNMEERNMQVEYQQQQQIHHQPQPPPSATAAAAATHQPTLNTEEKNMLEYQHQLMNQFNTNSNGSLESEQDNKRKRGEHNFEFSDVGLLSDEYKNDFEKVKLLNLLDMDSMDHLFVYGEKLENTPKLATSLMLMFYNEKYKTLLHKYPGLQMYLTFLIMYILHNSFEDFCNRYLDQSSEAAFKPQTTITLMYKNVNYRNTQSESSCVLPIINGDCGKKQATVVNGGSGDGKHPIFQTKFYKKNKILFKIGKICKKLIPGPFAAIHTVVTKKTFKIQKTRERSAYYIDGGSVNFSTPVLFGIHNRSGGENNRINFHGIEHSEFFQKYLENGLNHRLYQLNFNCLLKQYVVPYDGGPAGDKPDLTNVPNKCAIIKTINLYPNECEFDDPYSSKTFSNPIFYCDSSILQQYICGANGVTCDPEMEKELIRFYNSPQPPPPQQQQNTNDDK